jgi:ABC-2 type transport system permease protein
MKDIVGHVILISIPVLLIVLFRVIFTGDILNVVIVDRSLPYLTILTVGFTLTFQIYGSAISFETLGLEFFTPLRDRLLASPAAPRRLVVSVLVTSTLVSLFQSLAVMLFSILVLHSEMGPLLLLMPIFLVSIIFNQLLGTMILLLTKSVKTSNTITSIYGSIAPMTIGLYFPLPETAFFDLLRTVLTPLALANTAVLGLIEGDLFKAVGGTSALIVLSILLFAAIQPTVRRLSL